MINKDLNNINKELVNMETNISSFYQKKMHVLLFFRTPNIYYRFNIY